MELQNRYVKSPPRHSRPQGRTGDLGRGSVAVRTIAQNCRRVRVLQSVMIECMMAKQLHIETVRGSTGRSSLSFMEPVFTSISRLAWLCDSQLYELSDILQDPR